MYNFVGSFDSSAVDKNYFQEKDESWMVYGIASWRSVINVGGGEGYEVGKCFCFSFLGRNRKTFFRPSVVDVREKICRRSSPTSSTPSSRPSWIACCRFARQMANKTTGSRYSTAFSVFSNSVITMATKSLYKPLRKRVAGRRKTKDLSRDLVQK